MGRSIMIFYTPKTIRQIVFVFQVVWVTLVGVMELALDQSVFHFAQ